MVLNSVALNWAALDGGWMVAIVGYLVVFMALVVLYFVFSFLPKIIHMRIRKRLIKEGKQHLAEKDFNIPGQVNAAIATAVYLYINELHDKEDVVVTIKKVSKTYSPWSSKIYNMRSLLPRR